MKRKHKMYFPCEKDCKLSKYSVLFALSLPFFFFKTHAYAFTPCMTEFKCRKMPKQNDGFTNL